MEHKRADDRSLWLAGHRLRVYASGSVTTDDYNSAPFSEISAESLLMCITVLKTDLPRYPGLHANKHTELYEQRAQNNFPDHHCRSSYKNANFFLAYKFDFVKINKKAECKMKLDN